jgi:hypothetical protein
MQVAHAIKMFQNAIDRQWLRAEDEIVIQWWGFEDVLAFVDGDEYYDFVNDEVAREIWADVEKKVSRYDSPDNDVVRDEISAALDERMGAK